MPMREGILDHVLILDLTITFCIYMRGLCHKCFGSDLELVISKKEIICKTCFEKMDANN